MAAPEPGWWTLRWQAFREPTRPLGERMWSLAEIGCALVTLATVAVAMAAIAVDPFVAVPPLVKDWPMKLLLAGAVGYGTNFLAVKMLFEPRRPVRWWPLRVVWRQGLVPAKQAELAEMVGEEVAQRFLTPEAVVAELEQLVASAIEDEGAIERLQTKLLPILERELPTFVRRFLPETLEAIEIAIRDSLPAAEMKQTLLEIVDEWFADPTNQEQLADFLLELVRSSTPDLIRLLKRTLKRYGKSSSFRELAIGAGLATSVIEWDAFGRALEKQLGSKKSRRWTKDLVAKLAARIHVFADRVIQTDWLEDVKQRAGVAALASLERVAEDTLIPRFVALLERETFRSFVREELLPAAKPKVVAWIREGHLAPFLERFDVKGRVATAAANLDVDELEEMTKRVGAYHLAAIQVLGYALGIVVGLLGVFLDRVT